MEESVRFKPTSSGSFNPLSMYPVGSIYQSVNPTDPSELFGGTWERIKDVFMMAAGDTYAAGSKGGEAEHVLTVDEMPSHEHLFKRQQWFSSDTVARASGDDIFSWKGGTGTGGSTSYSYKGTVINSGGSQPHNNLPPYLAVYTWVRTA